MGAIGRVVVDVDFRVVVPVLPTCAIKVSITVAFRANKPLVESMLSDGQMRVRDYNGGSKMPGCGTDRRLRSRTRNEVDLFYSLRSGILTR